MFFAIVGQMQVDHDKAEQADGDVDEENHAPMKVADDEAAGDGAEHGTDETGNRDETHGANQFRFGEGANEGQPADGDHHGAAAALQNAAGHQQVNAGGDAAEQRPEREEPMAEANTRRVPKRSATQPLMGMNTARLNV